MSGTASSHQGADRLHPKLLRDYCSDNTANKIRDLFQTGKRRWTVTVLGFCFSVVISWNQKN